MAVRAVATAHRRKQVTLARKVARQIGRLWRKVAPQDIAASWRRQIPEAYHLLSTAQLDAADAATDYVGDALEAQGIPDAPLGMLNPLAWAGIASDGRSLAALLEQPAITALTDIGRGAPVDRALTAGAVELDMIVRTQVADAGRVADGVATTAQRHVDGYVRMLTLPSCSRCIILAGVFYEWNAGFERHPRCDCRHIPADEDLDEELLTNPQKVFESMTEAEQDKVFTKAGAQAIRDGADMAQVVNARRGANGLTPAGARITAEEAETLRGGRQRGRLERTDVFGQQLFTTTEGTTSRGVAGRRLGARETGVKTKGGRYRRAQPPRLMPESIYEIAGGDRAEAIRLLKRYGYLLK